MASTVLNKFEDVKTWKKMKSSIKSELAQSLQSNTNSPRDSKQNSTPQCKLFLNSGAEKQNMMETARLQKKIIWSSMCNQNKNVTSLPKKSTHISCLKLESQGHHDQRTKRCEIPSEDHSNQPFSGIAPMKDGHKRFNRSRPQVTSSCKINPNCEMITE